MLLIDNLVTLLKNINYYEHNLYLYILQIFKDRLIFNYFNKNKVEVWYCNEYEKAYLVSYNKNKPKNYKIKLNSINETYYYLNYLCPFNEIFIKNSNYIISNYLRFEFKLKWFLHSFYNKEIDKFDDVPLEIKLFYNKFVLKHTHTSNVYI